MLRHDQLSAYLNSSQFLARWASQNATPGYTDGHRQLYEWQTQLTCLQNAATALKLTVNIDTQTVISQLAIAILLPSFDSVNWTDDLKQQFEQVSVPWIYYTGTDWARIFSKLTVSSLTLKLSWMIS